MRRFFGVIGGIALGLVASQFPEYAQQYTQRLGGAVDELKIITEDFDRRANEAGLTRQEAFARFDVNDDVFVAQHGDSVEETFARYADLRATLDRIEGADAVERLSMLPQYVDSEIGRRTLQNFKPGVPVTMEGFAYAGVGVLLGYTIVSALFAFLALPFRRRRPVYR
jgi:hypothetical protein